MHRHLLFVIALLLLTACSKDEVLSTSSIDNDISFYVNADAATRAPKYFETNKQFRVYAWDSNDTPIIYRIDNYDASNIVCYDTSIGLWGTTQKYYWPDDKTKAVTFYAYYPADLSFNQDNKKINYTSSNGGGEDFLYAKTTQTFNNSDITPYHSACINFRHPLAKIVINGIITNPSLSVLVSSIEFCNVKSQGIFSFPSGSTVDFSYEGDKKIPITPTTEDTYGSWTEVSVPSNLAVSMASSTAIPLSYTETIQLTAEDGYLAVLPQTLSAWDRSTSIEATTGSYLKIGCTLKLGTMDYSDNGYIYCPIGGFTWEAGKSYIYSLSFGGGYDSNGKSILGPLTIRATILPWNPTDVERTENETIYR